MTEVYSDSVSPQISQVIAAGAAGRLDPWKDCLADGARPQDILISGADAIVFSDNKAYTTNVEFPINTGMESATLLARQR